jgi:hypothetical protein
MPAQGYARAEMQAAAPLMIRRADRAPLGALLLVIATLWLAAAISGWVGGKAAIIPGFGSSGAYFAGALGAALAVIALTWMVRGRIVVIGRGTVAVTVWSLLGRHAWHEPLANYREIRVDREQRPHRYGARSWYVVRLWHPEPGKTIELARAKDAALIERRAREHAGRCGLPLSWRGDQAKPAHGGERAHPIAAPSPPERAPVSVG